MKALSLPIFCTLPQTYKSYAPSVGIVEEKRYSEYGILPVHWRDGNVTYHLTARLVINGHLDPWGFSTWGYDESVELAERMGIDWIACRRAVLNAEQGGEL
jgi:hypothetical protein